MNTQRGNVKIISSNAIILPQLVGFQNTIFIDVHDLFKESVEDQNGTVTDLGLYSDPLMSLIELKPSCLCTSHISQYLQEFIADTQIRRILSERIAFECASLRHLRQPFSMTFYVEVTREVRVMLPFVTTVLSKAAPRDVFQRLFEEQRMESVDLERVKEQEEEATCSICMEDLFDQSHLENIIRLPDCSHLFHQDCIFEWLKRQNSCPLCRRVPYEEDHETAETQNWLMV